MTNKKIFNVSSEGDIETVIKHFIRVSKLKTKKKEINIKIPTERLGEILLLNVNQAFLKHDLGDPSNYHVHLYIDDRKV